MSSPFPGMDPYLEHPGYWSTFQQYLVTRLADTLREVLPRSYRTVIKERIFVEERFPLSRLQNDNQNCIVPNQVQVAPKQEAPNPPDTSPFWYIPTAPEETRETYLEIVQKAFPDQVVTAVEFLSLANKTPESMGRKLYHQQQGDRLSQDVHLLEIDLHRSGWHTVVAPWTRIMRRGSCHYLVSLCRAGGREFCEVWGISLRETLPKIALPLGPNEADLILDLQTLIDYCYEAGSFAHRIHYNLDPFFPLSHSDALWAEKLLLRSGSRE